MKILITGGSGTLGQEIVRQLLRDKNNVDRIVIYSRGEHKQVDMARTYPEYPDNIIRYDIGDIRDLPRLTQAMRGCDTVIHAAALKHVPVCEYNPQEAISTNVMGSKNVIDACNAAGVKRCIVVSTDKAVEPITLYGATKLTMERLAIAGNNLGACRFSVVRYANVRGSAGSVLPIWRKQHDSGEPITVTDKAMTRMWISLEDAASFVLSRFDVMQGGEVFVPNCKAERITETASDFLGVPERELLIKEIGIRPAEKLHEDLISAADSRDCWQLTDGTYACYPPYHDWKKEYSHSGLRMDEGFGLSSFVRKCDTEFPWRACP